MILYLDGLLKLKLIFKKVNAKFDFVKLFIAFS
jgi:hypothetical protein